MQVLLLLAATSLIGRMRMRAARREGAIEIGFPKWVRFFYLFLMVLFGAFVLGILVIAIVAMIVGHWWGSLFFAIIGCLFAGVCLWGMRDCRRNIAIDEFGVSEMRSKRLVAIAWNDVSVNTWKKLTGALITDDRGKEIIIPINLDGLDMVEEVFRQRVPAARITFSIDADGERRIFLKSR